MTLELLGKIVGPIIIFAGLVLNAYATYIQRNAEIKALADWKKVHEGESDKRDEAITELKEIAAALKATVAGQDRRLELLEERRKRLGY